MTKAQREREIQIRVARATALGAATSLANRLIAQAQAARIRPAISDDDTQIQGERNCTRAEAAYELYT